MGFGVERGNLAPRWEGSEASGGPTSLGVPTRGPGTDQGVGARKPLSWRGSAGPWLPQLSTQVNPPWEDPVEKAKPFAMSTHAVWRA
jgi:hypothetical protein